MIDLDEFYEDAWNAGWRAALVELLAVIEAMLADHD
jgi:hypothetical protein